jgi:hypothetical protein
MEDYLTRPSSAEKTPGQVTALVTIELKRRPPLHPVDDDAQLRSPLPGTILSTSLFRRLKHSIPKGWPIKSIGRT